MSQPQPQQTPAVPLGMPEPRSRLRALHHASPTVSEPITAAGILDQPFEVSRATDAEIERRADKIAREVRNVAELKHLVMKSSHEESLVFELCQSRYSLKQIEAAANIVSRATTYNKLRWEDWQRAFTGTLDRTYTQQDMMRARREAYEEGKLAERNSSKPEPPPPEIREWIQAQKDRLPIEEKNGQLERENARLRDLLDETLERLTGYEAENESLRRRIDELIADASKT